MANPSEDRTILRPVPTCDVGSLGIGALERFVLSNVDGRRTREEVAEATGMGGAEVDRILDKLVALGAVQLGGAVVAARAPSAESVDLDAELQSWIDEKFQGLHAIDHYALLGVPRDADRKAIKSAYYALAAKLHTDRYFGKKLGSFKSKMEQVFSRVTIAHDTLASKDGRKEYDDYLAERERTAAYERLMAMVDGEADFAEELRTSTTTKAAAPAKPASVAPPPAPPPPPTGVADPMVSPSPTTPLAPEQERARREMLARRLGGRNTTARRAVSSDRPSNPALRPQPTPQETKAATEALRRMYEERKDAARRSQMKKFVDAGEAALAKDDVVSAANHYRLAIRYSDDADIRKKFEEVNRRAREVMAEAYTKQARYEEQQQRWKEAAQSYGKAIEGRPDDPELQHAAANALRREGRDLHAAARHGEAAVQKNPNDVAFRVTLGHVYLDAGLFLRARRELEQALELEPGHARAKELLVQVKKLVS